jgi:hypothetical protein
MSSFFMTNSSFIFIWSYPNKDALDRQEFLNCIFHSKKYADLPMAQQDLQNTKEPFAV